MLYLIIVGRPNGSFFYSSSNQPPKGVLLCKPVQIFNHPVRAKRNAQHISVKDEKKFKSKHLIGLARSLTAPPSHSTRHTDLEYGGSMLLPAAPPRRAAPFVQIPSPAKPAITPGSSISATGRAAHFCWYSRLPARTHRVCAIPGSPIFPIVFPEVAAWLSSYPFVDVAQLAHDFGDAEVSFPTKQGFS
jgi:hypothetical protein